ncbi:MAG: dihydrolipoyl dehydrogenase family protein [Phycisphaerae bacterium]
MTKRSSCDYDAVVIGTGPGGNAASERIAQRGGTVCQIDKGAIGGTCVNVGCMPTKAMLAASQRFYQAGRDDGMGFSVTPPHLDGRAFMDRVHRMVDTLNHSMREKLESIDEIDLVEGFARVVDAHSVEIDSDGQKQTVSARSLLIATGSSPVVPDFLDVESNRIWLSDDALAAETVPDSVIILGGGPLGCEFATVWSELGKDVTIIEMSDRLLGTMDTEASLAARRLLEDRGVRFHMETSIRSGKVKDDRVELADDSRTFSAEHVLCAIGRRANMKGCGLENLGIDTERPYIHVDARCWTGIEQVYAVGDVADSRNYAHLAARMGTVAGDNIMGFEAADDRSVVPTAVYTHPEIACVGLCGEACENDAGEELVELSESYSHSGSAYVRGRQEGMIKLLVAPRSGRICGALWIGPHSVDMLHELVLAMRAELTIEQIRQTIHGHPSFQEMLHTLAEQFEQEYLLDSAAES